MSAAASREPPRLAARRLRSVLSLSLALATSSGGLGAQGPTAGEGPLQSDTLVPVDAEAAASLARGDLACARALGGGAGSELAWGRAFESWHEALALADLGEGVPAGLRIAEEALRPQLEERWPDRDGTLSRRTESVEYALERRLSGLDAAERRGWTDRFGPLALEALSAAPSELAGRGAELRRLDHLHPATEGAARAAIELFELAFEEGRRAEARTWLGRAERHARLAGWSAGAEAIARRRRALEETRPQERGASTPAWVRAATFESDRKPHPLLMPGLIKPDSFANVEGPPGIAFLEGERIAVQTTGSVWILSKSETDRAFEPWRVAMELGQPIPRTVERTGRDWPFLPESDGAHLYLVSARADGVASNFVQKFLPPRELDVPEPIWSLGGDGLKDGEGGDVPLAEILDPGLWEFQPGARLAGGLLLVQARHWTQSEQEGGMRVDTPGEARAWLLALDARSGRPRWRRSLCRGTDVVADLGGRFARHDLVRTPGLPPAVTGDRVFVGTNLGAGFLLDLADGRLAWSFVNRRRDAETPGWTRGGRPPVCPDPAGGADTILWAPADSDFLYALRAATDFEPGGGEPAPPILVHPPLAVGESEVLVGGDGDLALVLGRAGARRTLSAHELDTGRRYDSVFLGREERFLPGALVSETHVLFAGDRGLYRLDRRRELYLELFVPLDLRSDYAPGGLWSRGGPLFLLAKGRLFFLEAADRP